MKKITGIFLAVVGAIALAYAAVTQGRWRQPCAGCARSRVMPHTRDIWHTLRTHARTQHAGQGEDEGAPLSRQAFYADREEAEWGGISRCC